MPVAPRLGLLALAVSCGAPAHPAAPPAPISNEAPVSDAPPEVEPSPACRAAVAKRYESTTQKQAVDAHGRAVIVTDSDSCGMILEPVYFTRDAATFKPDAADLLADMLTCLDQTEHERLRLEVQGHAAVDEQQPDDLAQRRAEAVVHYLAACGVPVLGLSASAQPPSGASERDRRVDFLITERSP